MDAGAPREDVRESDVDDSCPSVTVATSRFVWSADVQSCLTAQFTNTCLRFSDKWLAETNISGRIGYSPDGRRTTAATTWKKRALRCQVCLGAAEIG